MKKISKFLKNIWGIGFFLSVKSDTKIKVYKYLLDLPEDKLFWYSLLLTLISLVSILMIISSWTIQGFKYLYLEKETLALIAFSSNGIIFVSNVITSHLLKRR